jgi:hypothetical protein
VKTTVNIPTAIFLRAKAKAAERHVSLGQFITEAIVEKLESEPSNAGDERMKWAGQLRYLRRETARINAIIEKEFDKIEPEDWV